ncbi:Uncharacterised protein [Moraxella caprae]|uniref:Uncharacterized protein n=1 Tax=Moraxella caprae TaxID=90240 RepID=A0A378QYI2_9GAMM|nr:hypothetical protein [Moraxella caprae]STZ08024.1 Uncharacterised protein [Moraxella caprae]
MLKNTPAICPHPSCHKVLDDVIYHHGIIFCPHCQTSLLVNPFLPELEKMTFAQFSRRFIKTQWKFYIGSMIIFAIFIAVIEVVANFDKLNLGSGFWITLSLMALILLGIGIYFMEKNLQNYHYYKLKNKPLLKGIDTYDLVKDDFYVSVALEDLKVKFNTFAPCCQNCHSQRLHQKIDKFHCQNCHHQFMINQKLNNINTYNLVITHILMFVVIRHFDSFYLILLFIPLLFLVNLISQYYWCKTPKWQLQSP